MASWVEAFGGLELQGQISPVEDHELPEGLDPAGQSQRYADSIPIQR